MDVVLVTDRRRDELLKQTLETLVGHNVHVVEDPDHALGVGGAKNKGAGEIKRTSNLVLFSDDDMYWLYNWDLMMEEKLERSGVKQLGAWSHPYNRMTHIVDGVGKVNACHGGGFVMRWEDWDRSGGFMDNSHGPGQSEDWEFSQRLVARGWKIGCVDPYVALHCGLHNCEGNPATGIDVMEVLLKRQVWALGLDVVSR